VTLNIRVRNSSSCSSDRVVKKSPAYVNRVGSGPVTATGAYRANEKTTPNPTSSIFNV